MSNLRKYLWIGAFAAASIIPVAAQQYPSPQQNPQDQVRHDSDDQNRVNQDQDQNRVNQDQDQVRRDQNDVNRRDRDDVNRTDRDRQAIQNNQDRDRDHNGAYNNGSYVGQTSQWVNTKAYQEGLKDGQHDRSKNKSQRAHERRWKNDNDRQAYSAGYDAGHRNNMRNDHDRDDQYRR